MDIHSVCLRDSYCNYYFCKLQTHKENNGYNRRNAECGSQGRIYRGTIRRDTHVGFGDKICPLLKAEKDKIKALIADISHQTKTPIANLLLYSELLLEEELPQQIEGNVSAIHEQTQKLKFLIESLVKLSRLENGILQLVPRMEKLQPMLERAVWELKQKAEEKGLQISLHNTDVEAYFDPKWTGEAIGNVIDNAIKYTEHGEICVSAISYEMFVRIDIADTGCGIREEELPKIFMRFYRSELVKDEEGVGIGLYLTREILQEQGGYIKVSSVYGQGSKFSIYLPKNNF